ncbi:MAG: hypothetical protein NVS4B9_09070 [Ktedonobacteraceae bacterium]
MQEIRRDENSPSPSLEDYLSPTTNSFTLLISTNCLQHDATTNVATHHIYIYTDNTCSLRRRLAL